MNLDFLIRDLATMFYQAIGFLHKYPNLIDSFDLSKIAMLANELATVIHDQYSQLLEKVQDVMAKK